jgi:tRNA nucleotidyltransferase/poly(A) polymerase
LGVLSALNILHKPTQVRPHNQPNPLSRIHGTEIDFVNLRSETYAEGSRIPEATFGTAEQDAFRRDLTINSLFYNIVTGEVEDLTGKGGSSRL